MNFRWLLALLYIPFLFSSPMRGQQSVIAAHAVLEREMPHLAPQIHLSLAPGDYAGKSDGFRIHGIRGNIHVDAATVPTLLFGVNWYLKYIAHLNVSTNGSQLGSSSMQLPGLGTPIVRPAPYPFRYALNENTDGYTTPYWDFARWQHEIDILALSGFNAVLIQRGNDLAVYQAFRDVGYTDTDIRNWITQPAHQNWQLMGNMCSGPVLSPSSPAAGACCYWQGLFTSWTSCVLDDRNCVLVNRNPPRILRSTSRSWSSAQTRFWLT